MLSGPAARALPSIAAEMSMPVTSALQAQAGQIAAHPALPAGDVQHPVTGHGGQQAGVRRDQWRRVADPLLVPLGELVIPRLRLRHAPTLIAPPGKQGLGVFAGG